MTPRHPGELAVIAGALLLLTISPVQAAFRTDNLERGKTVTARADQGLIFGTLRVLDEAGRTSFPSDAIFPRVPGLRLFGLWPKGKRSFSLKGLAINPDGTFGAWVPGGDYALVATWPDEDGDLETAVVALLRVPGDGRVFYTGELVVETQATGVFWKQFPSAYEIANVTAILGAAEIARQKLEKRAGSLPGPVWTLPWCTEGVPPDADPGNARSLARLDAGCGSTLTAPDEADHSALTEQAEPTDE